MSSSTTGKTRLEGQLTSCFDIALTACARKSTDEESHRRRASKGQGRGTGKVRNYILLQKAPYGVGQKVKVGLAGPLWYGRMVMVKGAKREREIFVP